jgi:hypothetical protein
LCRVCRERRLRSRAGQLLRAPALAIAARSNEMHRVDLEIEAGGFKSARTRGGADVVMAASVGCRPVGLGGPVNRAAPARNVDQLMAKNEERLEAGLAFRRRRRALEALLLVHCPNLATRSSVRHWGDDNSVSPVIAMI